jgi:hypothetical protein
MTPAELDQACAYALKRIAESINRTAAQQVRRMRESWAKEKGGAA